MPDIFDMPLKAGDKVVWDSQSKGLVTGFLLANEEDHQTIRVKRDSDGKIHYIQKTWRKGGKEPMMNLSAWFREELDRHMAR